MKRRKYDWNLEKIKVALNESNSLNEVLRKLNIPTRGNNINTLKRILKENKVSYEFNYFNSYLRRGINTYKLAENYLYNGSTIKPNKLLHKLIKDGIKEDKCESCGIKYWKDKPLVLQLHHIDGNPTNNELCNLQVLCPNCHSQTDNFCSKNREEKTKYICPDCGKEIRKTSKYCYGCSLKHRIRTNKPTKDLLLELIKTYKNNKSEIGKLYGVSCTAVIKWYRTYGIPLH